MKRFGYALDPVGVAACAGYALNRWVIPGAWKGWFLHGYFNDVLFIPAALPLMLWLQRQLRLRNTDTYPTWEEILMHWVVWSVAAELVAPHLFSRATGDPWDVVAYAAGAVMAGLIWTRP